MISPLAIATDGYLNSPLSVAVDGYLTIVTIPPVPAIVDDGGDSKLRLLMPDEKLDRLLKREDDEILQIIIEFMEKMNEP